MMKLINKCLSLPRDDLHQNRNVFQNVNLAHLPCWLLCSEVHIQLCRTYIYEHFCISNFAWIFKTYVNSTSVLSLPFHKNAIRHWNNYLPSGQLILVYWENNPYPYFVAKYVFGVERQIAKGQRTTYGTVYIKVLYHLLPNTVSFVLRQNKL